MQTFKLNTGNIGQYNMSHLQDCFSANILDDMIAKFGAPKDGYWDPESGYEGQEWGFVSDVGQYIRIYTRFLDTSWHIGGFNKVSATDFKVWLFQELGLDQNAIKQI